jgi:hypothetical protein
MACACCEIVGVTERVTVQLPNGFNPDWHATALARQIAERHGGAFRDRLHRPDGVGRGPLPATRCGCRRRRRSRRSIRRREARSTYRCRPGTPAGRTVSGLVLVTHQRDDWTSTPVGDFRPRTGTQVAESVSAVLETAGRAVPLTRCVNCLLVGENATRGGCPGQRGEVELHRRRRVRQGHRHPIAITGGRVYE